MEREREDALAGDVALYEVRSEDEAEPGEGYVAIERASGEKSGAGRRSGSEGKASSEEKPSVGGEPGSPPGPGSEKPAAEDKAS